MEQPLNSAILPYSGRGTAFAKQLDRFEEQFRTHGCISPNYDDSSSKPSLPRTPPSAQDVIELLSVVKARVEENLGSCIDD